MKTYVLETWEREMEMDTRNTAENGQEREKGSSVSRRPTPPRRPAAGPKDPYIRAENEDDDGYDPYSDRRPEPEPLFECDPWA